VAPNLLSVLDCFVTGDTSSRMGCILRAPIGNAVALRASVPLRPRGEDRGVSSPTN
jgi:hypothetical protein